MGGARRQRRPVHIEFEPDRHLPARAARRGRACRRRAGRATVVPSRRRTRNRPAFEPAGELPLVVALAIVVVVGVVAAAGGWAALLAVPLLLLLGRRHWLGPRRAGRRRVLGTWWCGLSPGAPCRTRRIGTFSRPRRAVAAVRADLPGGVLVVPVTGPSGLRWKGPGVEGNVSPARSPLRPAHTGPRAPPSPGTGTSPGEGDSRPSGAVSSTGENADGSHRELKVAERRGARGSETRARRAPSLAHRLGVPRPTCRIGPLAAWTYPVVHGASPGSTSGAAHRVPSSKARPFHCQLHRPPGPLAPAVVAVAQPSKSIRSGPTRSPVTRQMDPRTG